MPRKHAECAFDSEGTATAADWEHSPQGDFGETTQPPKKRARRAEPGMPSFVQECMESENVEELAIDDIVTETEAVRAYRIDSRLVATVAAVEVVNIVSVARVESSLDLMFLASHCRQYGASFNPRRFFYMTVRLDEPLCTVMVFPTGCIMTMRARRPEHAREATDFVLRMIREVEVCGRRPYASIKCQRTRVGHLVGKFQMPFDVDLIGLLERWPSSSTVQSDNFDGVSIPLSEVDRDYFAGTKVLATVYADGGCTIMGSRRPTDLTQAQASLFPAIVAHMVVPPYVTAERRQSAARDLERTKDGRFLFYPVDAHGNEALIKRKLGSCERTVATVRSGQLTRREHAGPIVSAGMQNALALHTESIVHRRRREVAERSNVRPTSINIVEGREAKRLTRRTDEGRW